MRRPARATPAARQQSSEIVSFPAPVGGWNANNSIADMKETDAITLDNWFPRTAYCEIRGGSADYATGMTGTGKTLMVYNAMDGTSEMFCSTASGVYDVSFDGAVGAAVAARTDGKHQWTMFGDGTNQYLIMVNGVDKPLYYDGTTWLAVDGATSPALTGITTTNLINVAIFKGRLIFTEKDSMSFWYLSAGFAGGALTEYDLSGVAQMGGYLVAVRPWTVDAGDGPDDRLVCITSQGEIIVFQGTDPSNSSTWALVGIYRIGKPIGRKCTLNVGPDLVILTQNGAFPLTTILNDFGIDYTKALSNKIESVFNDSARQYQDNFGWMAVSYPNQSAVLVNVPVAEDGTHYQYVMNTITRSWCRFIGWDAEDFAVFNSELYYCQGTKVVQAWTGTGDNGVNIDAYGKTAFSYFGKQTQLKFFKLFRPVLRVNGSLSFLIDIDVDFGDSAINGIASYAVTSGAKWGISKWGIHLWAAGLQLVKEWQTPTEWTGYAAAGKIKISTKSLNVQWMSTDYVFENGGIL